MKAKLTTLSSGALILAALDHAYAQYTPPPPPAPFNGFINQVLSPIPGYTNHWDIGGVDRERYVAYQGYAIAGKTGSADFRDHGGPVDNQYLLSRIRLHAGYHDSWWGAYMEGQSTWSTSDHRAAYANVPPVTGTSKTVGYGPESDQIDIHQAYLTAGNQKEFPLTVKVGRQELSYGEERLIGAFDWNNIGRSFDDVKLRWADTWGSVDAFTGMPVVPREGQFDMPNNQDWFSGVYATLTPVPKTIVEGYFLSRNSSRTAVSTFNDPEFPQPTARDVYTIGGRLKSKPGELYGFDYTLEGAYQFGNFAPTATAARMDHSAFMFVSELGYTFSDVWAKPRLGVEFDYGSGSDGGSTHGTFDMLYPTPHKFLGSMDLFSLQNLQALGANLTLKPTKRWSIAVIGNAFWLADTRDYLYNAAGAPRATAPYGKVASRDPFVGTSVTAIAGYAVTSFLTAEVGYGHFFSGTYIDQTMAGNGGARDADFAYVQTTFKF